MSKKEQINHRIDIAKTALNTLLIAFFGWCAFVFVNIDTLRMKKLVVCVICGSSSLVFSSFIYAKLDKEIGKL